MNPCVIPTPSQDTVGDGRWMSMHNRFVQQAKNNEPEVVLIGDSIIQQLQFSSLWTEKISSLHCINFGIGGDSSTNAAKKLKPSKTGMIVGTPIPDVFKIGMKPVLYRIDIVVQSLVHAGPNEQAKNCALGRIPIDVSSSRSKTFISDIDPIYLSTQLGITSLNLIHRRCCLLSWLALLNMRLLTRCKRNSFTYFYRLER